MTVKYLTYFLFIALLGSLISCNVPNQPINNPPSVTITANTTTIETGDTLRLTIHAEDPTLISGTVDFKDGTVLVFNNLKSVFDTTLTHIFKSVGVLDVTISFSDGDKITSKQLNITVSNNPPPVVSVATNRTTIETGDTLRLTIHAEDPTLISGAVDFKDGTVLVFNNLKSVFDTTLTHIFKSVGVLDVTISFSDGDKITSKQLNITVSNNPPPVVSVATNRTTINLGDTVLFTIHASDNTLSGGNLTFGDGVIYFSNLHHSFDTTIAHVYSAIGTYNPRAEFYDGNNNWNWADSRSVSVQCYFSLYFYVGIIWRFHYDSTFARTGAYSITLSGIHTWQIISSSVVGSDTIFTIQQIRNDTTTGVGVEGPPLIVNDTSLGSITVSNSSIRYSIPHLLNSPFSIPNHSYITSYSAYANVGSVNFAKQVGLTESHCRVMVANGYINENLTLIGSIFP